MKATRKGTKTTVPVTLSSKTTCENSHRLEGAAEQPDDEPADEEHQADEWFVSDSEVNAFRKKHRIAVYTRDSRIKDCPNDVSRMVWPIKIFKDLQLHYEVDPWIVDSIQNNLKLTSPTSIQMQVMPQILTRWSLLANAPTGSGKTLAFLVPLVALLKTPKKEALRCLLISPTRELAKQTLRELVALCSHKNFRCKMLERQTVSSPTPQRLDFGVCTPLKLVQILADKQLALDNCRHIVLDEADRLLDMGFASQIDEILSHANLAQTQLLLFSATLQDNVIALAETIIPSANRISVGAPLMAPGAIDQQLVFVTKEEGKLITFRQLLLDGKLVPPALIFVQSIERAQQLYEALIGDKLRAEVIHSGKSKAERDAIVKHFRERKKCWMLICTDLMARGVDFKGVNVVVNWDFPQSTSIYLHRIGRTGRAGRKGVAITFFTTDDVEYLPTIIGAMRQSGCEIPSWMAQLKKPNRLSKKRLQKRPPRRKHISTKLHKPP